MYCDWFLEVSQITESNCACLSLWACVPAYHVIQEEPHHDDNLCPVVMVLHMLSSLRTHMHRHIPLSANIQNTMWHSLRAHITFASHIFCFLFSPSVTISTSQLSCVSPCVFACTLQACGYVCYVYVYVKWLDCQETAIITCWVQAWETKLWCPVQRTQDLCV